MPSAARLTLTTIFAFALLAPALGAVDGAVDGAIDGVATDGIRIFEPAYYQEFDPVSALELVFRTPGFNPQEQDGGRGLSGVRSNILIDGERPPPKGQSARQQLRQIPVNAVMRVELIDAGSRPDIDMQGYPQVVNVVTTQEKPAYYEVTTQILHDGTGAVDENNERNTEIQANGSFSWKEHEFTLRANTRDRTNQSPADFVSIDPANPEQRISSVNRSNQDNYGFEMGADLALPSDSALNITGRVSSWQQSSAPLSIGPVDPQVDEVNQSSDNSNDEHELSAEYRRPFGADNNVMLAFVDNSSIDRSESSLDSAGTVRSSRTNGESGESALRLLVTQTLSEQLIVRTEATAAFNYFDGGFQLFENGVELPVEGSDNRVEEDRHSVEGSVDWNFTSKWLLQTSVGVESYDISSRDSSSGIRTDPKGKVSLSFRPQPRTTFSLESTREIGQLGFSQFLASSNLSSEIVTAGASALEPERRWVHAAKYDRRFGDVGVMRLQLARQTIDNPVRSVALTDSIIVAQNTAPETLDRLTGSIELPFEKIERQDLILQLAGLIAQSDTIDPVTGENHPASGFTKRQWSVELRRDPGDGPLSWSASVSHRTYGREYSVRRIGYSEESNEWNGYVQWEPINGLRFRVEVDGPRWSASNSSYFGAVRQPGLDPSYVSGTMVEYDRSTSFTVEWRRTEHLEIRASLNSRPKIRRIESLTPFGETIGTVLTNEFARTPRAVVRFRVYR